ncbi:MAG: helix-turn-helix transcriptional regulator [Proteobacteria bacterium]|nr:helix-turn-helix transcriptional regulator [Pseudomonadota bacterium]
MRLISGLGLFIYAAFKKIFSNTGLIVASLKIIDSNSIIHSWQLAAIGRYLKGIGEPTTATLQKLADYFKVPVWELRGIKGIADIDLSGDKSSEREAYYNLVSATKNLLNTVLSKWPEVEGANRKATLDLARSIIVDVGGHDEKYLELAEVAMEVVRRSAASRKKI